MSSNELRRLITKYFGQYIVRDISIVSPNCLHIVEHCKNKVKTYNQNSLKREQTKKVILRSKERVSGEK
jgi:hypothetical protein